MSGIFKSELNYNVGINYKLKLWFFLQFVVFVIYKGFIFSVIVRG